MIMYNRVICIGFVLMWCAVAWSSLLHNFLRGKIAIINLSISLNMCLGCSKEPSHWKGSFEYPQHMFWLRNKKNNFSVTRSNLGAAFQTLSLLVVTFVVCWWSIFANILHPDQTHGLIQKWGGAGGRDPPPLLKDHKKLGFLSNTGLDPLKKCKATRPEFNVRPSLGRQQNSI